MYMKYFYYILAIILVLLLVLSLYIKQEGFISIKSDIPNGEGLSKRYLLHNLRLLNENIRDIQIVKKTDTTSQENTALLKINGEDNGKISDFINEKLKNVEYINLTMRRPGGWSRRYV